MTTPNRPLDPPTSHRCMAVGPTWTAAPGTRLRRPGLVWETEEDLRRMQENPEFLRNLEAAGWPSEPTEQIYQVHATIP